jgi:CelD/BcsL family acetyltransferase involved in cellulose biosynthesis
MSDSLRTVPRVVLHAAPARGSDAPVRGLRCRTLTRLSDWEQVRPWWDELLARSTDATPWQSWDYLSRWWRHLSDGKALRLFIVERDGRPVLALPLQISRRFEMLGLPVRMIEPIGMIMDVNRPRLALGALDPDAYRCAFEALWQARRDWDLIRIDEKLSDDPEVELLKDFAANHGLWYRDIFSHLCPNLDLQQDWDHYLASRGRRLRKNLRAAQRKLETLGPVALRSYSTPAEVHRGYEHVLELHRASWKGRKGVEQSQSPQYQSFYREWLASLAQRDAARILVLFCGDRPVAATIAILRGETYYSAQIVHDEQFRAVSPGTLLESLEIEGLMRAGRCRHYDFLGAFLNNKLRWTDTARATSLVFVFRPSLRALVIEGYYFRVKPWIKSAWRWLLRRPQPAAMQVR